MITIEQLKDVKNRTEALYRYLDIENKKIQVEEEQLRTQAPGFWDDAKAAEEQMKKVEENIYKETEQFARLVILMKYKMQSQGYKYLQHMIIGKMLDRTTTKTMRSLKFVDKIEQSDRYKRLVEKKYAKLLKLKGPRVILEIHHLLNLHLCL